MELSQKPASSASTQGVPGNFSDPLSLFLPPEVKPTRLDISKPKELNCQNMNGYLGEPENQSAVPGQASTGLRDREAQWFTTTLWKVVLTAGQGDSPQAEEALESLCRTYWYPLYAYIRRKNYSPEDAQDITQGFFARFLVKGSFAKADPKRGRFRSFLLASLENYLKDWRKHASAEKRGGGQATISINEVNAEERYQCEPVDNMDPAKAYERTWLTTLLTRVLDRLKAGFEAEGRLHRFEQLKGFLLEEEDCDYAEAASKLGITVNAARQDVFRLRGRFREILKEEIAHTVTTLDEVDGEINYLFELLSNQTHP